MIAPRLVVDYEAISSLDPDCLSKVIVLCSLESWEAETALRVDSSIRWMIRVEPRHLNKKLRTRLFGSCPEVAIGSILVTWGSEQPYSPQQLVACWPYLEELVVEGKVDRLGVVDFGELVLSQFRDRVAVPPAFNLVEVHPYCQMRNLRQICEQLGVDVHTSCWYGPSVDDGESALAREPVIRKIATEFDCPALSVVLSWTMQSVGYVHMSADQMQWAAALCRSSAPVLKGTQLAGIDSLDCEWLSRRRHALATLYGTGAVGMKVNPRKSDDLEYGLYRNMYLPASPSMALNRKISELLWRWLFNLPASLAAAIRPIRTGGLARRLADELRSDGITITSLAELGIGEWLPGLVAAGEHLAADVAHKERHCAQKDYRYYGEHPEGCNIVDVQPIQVAVRDYLGLCPIEKDVRLSVIPPRRRKPVKQQNWHTDVEDFSLIKILVYLSDVRSASDGALTYVKGSHPFGEYALETAELMRSTFVCDPKPGLLYVIPDREFFTAVAPELADEVYGPAGTVVLMDPRGFHKGGHALRKARIVMEAALLAPHQIHPLPGAPSLWRSVCFPFRWKNCVSKYRDYAYGAPSATEIMRERIGTQISRLRRAFHRL